MEVLRRCTSLMNETDCLFFFCFFFLAVGHRFFLGLMGLEGAYFKSFEKSGIGSSGYIPINCLTWASE